MTTRGKNLRNASVKLKLGGVVTLAILVVAAALLVVGHQVQQHEKQAYQDAYAKSMQELWEAISTSRQGRMAANFKPITRNRNLSAALYRGNADAVRDAIGPTLTRLQAQDVIDNLVIVGSDGQVMFSGESSGEAPLAARRALEQGKVIQGLERTADGRLVNVAAFPLYDRADLVGAGVYQESVAVVAERMREATGRAIQIRERGGQVVATAGEVAEGIVPGDLAEPGYFAHDQGERVLGVGVMPVRGLGDDTVGTVIAVEDVTEQRVTERWLLLTEYGVVAVALVLALALVGFYMQRVLRPLDRSIVQLEGIADGDLTGRIENDRNDEFGRLLDALARMGEDLNGLVGRIARAADEVVAGANQVAEAERHTSAGVNDQQAELEHLAAALNEMSASAGEVAQNINQLAQNAQDAMSAVDEGGRVVRESVGAIEHLAEDIRTGGEAVARLEQHSEKIGSVLDVIKTIAEQTNLLALNAAIEAARAGEQGRGFAVVADEVRTLAGRTQDSTAEIEEIISGVQSGVSDAVDVMNRSVGHAEQASGQAETIGNSLESVREQVSRITDLGSQVATAAEEQSATTEEMNRNVHRVTSVAEETAQRSQQSGEAIRRLSSQAEALKSEVDHFKVS